MAWPATRAALSPTPLELLLDAVLFAPCFSCRLFGDSSDMLTSLYPSIAATFAVSRVYCLCWQSLLTHDAAPHPG